MGSSCLVPAQGALGGDLALLTRSQHPEQLPASLCSHKAEGLAWLAASSASPKDRICPSPSPAHAPAAGWAVPHLASPQTHLGASIPTTAPHPQSWLRLCTTPQVFILSRSLAKQPPPCSLGKSRCLQVARRKGSGEEPFNLFSHSNIQTGSRSLCQEVSAFGKRSAIQGHVLERALPRSRGREGKHPRAQQGTEPRWCKGGITGAGFLRSDIILCFSIQCFASSCKKITNSCLEAFDEPQLVGSYLVRRLRLDPCKGSQRGGSSSKPPLGQPNSG